MKIAAFVPIKLNSERLSNKNILPLGGRSLCYHIFEKLHSAGLNPYVFCSEPSIMNYVPEYVRFQKRDKDLDTDKTKGLEIYRRFADVVDAETYVLAHATSPFLKSSTILEGVLGIEQGFDSAFTALRHQTFAWYKDQPLNYNLSDVPRTQDIEPVLTETSGLFVYTKEVLASGRRVGDKPMALIVDPIEGWDIDTKQDYELACRLTSLFD